MLQRLELLGRPDRHRCPCAGGRGPPLSYRLDVLLGLGDLALDVGLLGLRRDEQVADQDLRRCPPGRARRARAAYGGGARAGRAWSRAPGRPAAAAGRHGRRSVRAPLRALTCAGTICPGWCTPADDMTTAVHGSVTVVDTWTSTVSASSAAIARAAAGSHGHSVAQWPGSTSAGPPLAGQLAAVVVAQVGGDEDVGAGRVRLVEQLVARAAAHRDPADRSGQVAGDPDPAGRRRQRVRDPLRERRRACVGWSSEPTRPEPVPPVARRGAAPAARRRRRPAPGPARRSPRRTASSALVCATCSPHPAASRRVTTRPLAVPPYTVEVPRRYSGWCVTSRSAPSRTASSTTSSTGSMASRTVRTSASGSPQTGPTASHSAASSGG